MKIILLQSITEDSINVSIIEDSDGVPVIKPVATDLIHSRDVLWNT